MVCRRMMLVMRTDRVRVMKEKNVEHRLGSIETTPKLNTGTNIYQLRSTQNYSPCPPPPFHASTGLY
jgi:hypothetical protein